jgi:hypothetical protein
MQYDFDNKNINIESTAQKAITDEKLLGELIENLKSKKDTIRENSFNTLLFMSENHPEVLYPRWDYFAGMIDSDNAFWKHMAVRLIANITKVDIQDKFDIILNKYFDLLNDSVIVAGHVTANSGKIAKAKPQLQTKITNKLLNIDRTTQKHKDLIKAGAIKSFDEYFEESQDKKRIMNFVKKQLNSESPKTRKTAKAFLEKWAES